MANQPTTTAPFMEDDGMAFAGAVTNDGQLLPTMDEPDDAITTAGFMARDAPGLAAFFGEWAKADHGTCYGGQSQATELRQRVRKTPRRRDSEALQYDCRGKG